MSPGPSTSDNNLVSSSSTAIQSVSTIPPTTMRKFSRSFRDEFFRLPPEIQCMIYDCLVAHRAFEVLGDSNDYLGFCPIEKLLRAERTELSADIREWLKSRRNLVFNTNFGLFDPRTAVFSASFAFLPYFGRRVAMEKLAIEDIIAWDKFCFSEFNMKNVRQIRIDLHRNAIFTGRQGCLESFKTDLRSIANFRNLERIDIDCDTHMSFYNEWKYAQDSDAEPAWNTVYADEHLRRIWRNFWRYGGWCHPARACTCCALPEIRLRGYGTEWQLLDFEPEIPESIIERTTAYGQSTPLRNVLDFERRFGKDAASVRKWLMREVAYSKQKHVFREFYRQKKQEMEELEREPFVKRGKYRRTRYDISHDSK